MKEIELQDEVSDEICEKCGIPLVYKMGRFGKFLACSGFPDCRNTKPIVKNIGVTARNAMKAILLSVAAKKAAYFSAVINILDAITYPGTVRRASRAPNAKRMLVIKRNKSGAELQCHSVRI